jgi:protocatechuate 3,4-dioxygenase beta subunit
VPVRPDGGYEISLGGPAGNKLRVTAIALDHASAASEPVAVVEGQFEYLVNVNLESGKELTGKVIAKPGGAAVAGAMISLNARGSRGSGVNSQVVYPDGFSSRGGSQTVWAVTDVDGRFSIAHVNSASYSVTARADGYVAGVANVDLAASNNVTVEIEPEQTIEGFVAFADGTPVEGASISATRDTGAAQGGAGGVGGMGGAGGMRPAQSTEGIGSSGASTTSGSGGVFRLNGLSSGAYRLQVGGGRQGDVNIRSRKTEPVLAGTRDLKIVVEPGGVIAGRVLDPGKRGVASLYVNANPEPVNGKNVEGAESRQSRTKEDGSFSIVGLADVTTYSVNVQVNQGWDMAGGSMWKNAAVKGVAVGAGNLEIVLEEGLSITGHVVDGEGKPVPNSYLYCTTPAVEGKGRQGRNAMTDADGAFTVGGLESGDCSFTLQTSGPGALVLQNGDKVPAGSRDVRLVATVGVSIKGVVVDDSGGPIEGAMINVNVKSGGGRGGYARSGKDGSFEATGLVAGATYNIQSNLPGRVRGKAEDVSAGADGVRVVMPKGFEASGRVLDEKGAPVKGGQIFVQSSGDSSLSQSAAIDESGNFTLKGLAEGVYEAQAMTQSATTKSLKKCGTLKAGESGVELRIEP